MCEVRMENSRDVSVSSAKKAPGYYGVVSMVDYE